MAERSAEPGEVIVDGKRLETLSFAADAHKPTIVMLHEGLGSVSMWKDFPEQLAKSTGCGVLVYSRYGHGKSERLNEKRSIEFMHREAQVALPGLLDRLNIVQPILLGHSDGASICVIYAGLFPTQLRAVILEAPHVFVEDLTVESIAKIRTTYQTTDLPKKLGRYHEHVDETFWGWNDVWLEPKFREWNIEESLPGIRCPTLVIQGEQDEYGSLAQVSAITRRVQNAQSSVLPDCGHSPHRDQPEKTLAEISKFVRNVTRNA